MEYSKVGLRWGSKSNWISPSVMIQQPCLADASIACKLTSHLMFQRKKNCWRTAVRITVMHKYDSAECFWVVSFFYIHIYWIIFVDLKWGKTPRLLLLCTCSWSTSFLQVFFFFAYNLDEPSYIDCTASCRYSLLFLSYSWSSSWCSHLLEG